MVDVYYSSFFLFILREKRGDTGEWGRELRIGKVTFC